MSLDISCHSHPHSFFICHPGTLGDVLLSLEAIRAIKNTFSSHRVILLSQSAIGQLLYVCGEIDESWSLDTAILGDFLENPSALPLSIQDQLRRCTHAVFWMTSFKNDIRASLEYFGIESGIVCSYREAHLHSVHVEDRFLETLHHFSVQQPRIRESLCMPQTWKKQISIEAGVQTFLTGGPPFVVAHPGSGSHHKCSPAPVWAELLQCVSKRYGVRILIVGGPADEQAVSNLSEELGAFPYTVITGKDLGLLAWLFTHAALFIGHDSGLTHLVAALGVKTLVLFGPTEPAQWGPRGKKVFLLRGAVCQCQDWERVKTCHEKPCLQFQIASVIEVIDTAFFE